MQRIIISRFTVIPAVALLFALSPFSKAHADLVGSQWSVKYYTPTDSGLASAPTTPVGDLVGDFPQTLEYCINEERYNTTVVFKEYTYYEDVNGRNVLRTDHYGVLPNGLMVKNLKYEMDDGSLNNMKLAPADAERLGYTINVTPKNPGIVSYSKNCVIENYAPVEATIQPYGEELAVEDCPAGQTVDGVIGGRTQKVGNIPNYFKPNADGTIQLLLKLSADDSYVPYNNETYPRVSMWGREALAAKGLVEQFGGEWQQGSEGACKTPLTAENKQETQILNCPAGETGAIGQYQNYTLWSNGTRTNESGWITYYNTCVKSDLTYEAKQETRSQSCPVGESGIIWQYQNYYLWSNGARTNETGWINYYNTCAKIPDQTVAPTKGYNEYAVSYCPAGQTVGGIAGGSTERWGTVPIYTGKNSIGQIENFFKDKNDALVKINSWLDFPELSEEPYAFDGSFVEAYSGEWIDEACAPSQQPDLSVAPHFDHDQYIYDTCPAGQTVGGVDGGPTQKQGSLEIWIGKDKNGVDQFYIKDGKSGALTPINLADYTLPEPPYFQMPASFMYTYNGKWTAGLEAACQIPVTYTFESEYQTVDCPADMTGSISQSRLVKKGSDGSVVALIDWYTIMSSCQLPEPEQPTEPVEPEQPVEPTEPETPVEPTPVWESAGIANVSFTCPAGQTIGAVMGNGNVREGLIPFFTKGSEYAFQAADGSFSVVAVNKAQDGSVSVPGAKESDVATYGGKWLAGSDAPCGEPSQFQAMTDWKTETVVCKEAQTGHITYDYNRSWDYDAKNNITKNDSGWVSSVRENTCKDLEDALIEQEEIQKSEQCPDGQYGSITVKGKIVTYGLSGSKFIETDRINNCVAELDQFEKVTQVRDCPEGQVGQINEFMMKAVDTKGNESFPYGKTWVQESNTCTNPVSADDSESTGADSAKGLLSNQTLKASDNVNLDKLLNYLNVVQDVSPSSDYKLNIVLDTFDNINLEKIQAVATKWKQVSGGKVVLGDAPRFAKSYIGYDAITKDNVNEFVITAAYYSNGNITVTAKQVGKMKTGKNIIFNVPFAKI